MCLLGMCAPEAPPYHWLDHSSEASQGCRVCTRPWRNNPLMVCRRVTGTILLPGIVLPQENVLGVWSRWKTVVWRAQELLGEPNLTSQTAALEECVESHTEVTGVRSQNLGPEPRSSPELTQVHCNHCQKPLILIGQLPDPILGKNVHYGTQLWHPNPSPNATLLAGILCLEATKIDC